MSGAAERTALAQFEEALERGPDRYVLRLYVNGASTASAEAIRNVRRICDEHLAGHVELDIVDLRQNPVLVAEDQIIAAPTLIKRLPSPLRQLVGDMSNEEVVLLGLDLRVAEPSDGGG